jgi:hypothetical protein
LCCDCEQTNADGKPEDHLTPEEREMKREQKEERQRRRAHRELERGVGEIHIQYEPATSITAAMRVCWVVWCFG